MTHRIEGVAPATRLLVADVLTASRVLVAAALVFGDPPAGAVVLLVTWAWISDSLDGPLARSTGGNGQLAALDHVVDAAVGVGLVWYLGTVGFIPTMSTRVAALALVALWAATRRFAVQMLLQTGAYAALLWWAFTVDAPGRLLLPLIIGVVLMLEWGRFRRELVPTFLRGWRDVLAGRQHSD